MSRTCSAVSTAVPVNRSWTTLLGSARSTISATSAAIALELVGVGSVASVRAAGEDRAAQQPVPGDIGR